MKYITLFEGQTAFDEAKSTLDRPNVSYVKETGNVYSLAVDANILMVSVSGYQLYSEEGDYWTFEYTGTEEYNGKKYFKYSLADTMYILAPTRSITKVTFPFDDYYICQENDIIPFSINEFNFDSLYGFTSVPENKVLMKPRTDIGTNTNGKDYVDLGLTSGTLWATMNVGAASETDYGSYFQWGDIEDKSNANCTWESYKYGDEYIFSKYNTGLMGCGGTIDNKLILDLEDDAARANMGGDWRMPTNALMEELVSETINMWIDNYNGTGVNGRKFTSKTNGKSIFIPASGYRSGSSFYVQGIYCNVWSSLLNTSDPNYALGMFSSDYVNTRYCFNRYSGQSVRGVL